MSIIVWPCVRCGVDKREEQFRLRKSFSNGLHYRGRICQACHGAKSLDWRHANPDKIRVYNKRSKAKDPEGNSKRAMQNHYKRKFGITIEGRDELLAKQRGKCMICERTTPTKRGWCVDHDHRTGRIRAILCAPCNSMIGLAKEKPEVLKNAAAYVEACDVANDYS